MKLLFCTNCGDVFNLTKKEKICSCGETKGRYLDNLNAIYSGGIPLGFTNNSFNLALILQPKRGNGKEFTAFVIPEECPTMKKVE